MAFSKLYLTTKTAPYTPATIRGAWDASGSAVTRALDPSTLGGGVITSVAVAEAINDPTYDVLLYRGVSGPLAAQTLSGTVNVILGVLESNALQNAVYHVHIYATQGDSDTPRGDVLTDFIDTGGTSEWPTTAAGKAFDAGAQTLAALALTAGDRLVVEIGYRDNSDATSRTGTLRYGTQDATSLLEVADLAVAGTDVTLKAGTLAFSVSIVEVDSTIRTSQLAVELVNTGTGEIRISQLGVEVIVGSPPPPIAVSQLAVELVVDGGNSPIHVSQLVAETVLTLPTAPVAMSQFVVEVITPMPRHETVSMFFD